MRARVGRVTRPQFTGFGVGGGWYFCADLIYDFSLSRDKADRMKISHRVKLYSWLNRELKAES